MVLIVKRLIPVYSELDDVPKKFHNLRKAVYVTTFKFPYPSIPDILVKEYGLQPDEKIIVFWMKEVSLPHFNRYRTKFRKIYSGSVKEFGEHILRRRKSKKQAKNEVGTVHKNCRI